MTRWRRTSLENYSPRTLNACPSFIGPVTFRITARPLGAESESWQFRAQKPCFSIFWSEFRFAKLPDYPLPRLPFVATAPPRRSASAMTGEISMPTAWLDPALSRQDLIGDRKETVNQYVSPCQRLENPVSGEDKEGYNNFFLHCSDAKWGMIQLDPSNLWMDSYSHGIFLWVKRPAGQPFGSLFLHSSPKVLPFLQVAPLHRSHTANLLIFLLTKSSVNPIQIWVTWIYHKILDVPRPNVHALKDNQFNYKLINSIFLIHKIRILIVSGIYVRGWIFFPSPCGLRHYYTRGTSLLEGVAKMCREIYIYFLKKPRG